MFVTIPIDYCCPQQSLSSLCLQWLAIRSVACLAPLGIVKARQEEGRLQLRVSLSFLHLTMDNWSKCWDSVTVECSALNRTTISPFPTIRECHRRGGRQSLRAGGWVECHEMLSCRRDMSVTPENPQQLPAQDWAHQHSVTDGRGSWDCILPWGRIGT